MAIDVFELKQRELDYCGVTAWHNAGYRGQGVTCVHLEAPTSEHGASCLLRVQDAAPGADSFLAVHSYKVNNTEVLYEYVEHNGERLPFADFCEKYDVKVLSRSKGGDNRTDKPISRLYNEAKEKHNLVFFSSAGNDGTAGAGSSIPKDVALWVGACSIASGTPKMKNYSSLGEVGEVDFSDFTGVRDGTSFSTPFLAGKAALVIGRYGDMSQDELAEYFKLCAEPIFTKYEDDDDYEGDYDRLSGYGLVVLPEPSKRYITLTIGDKHWTVDGNHFEMDVAPMIKNNRTFVPIRFIAEALGAEVGWNHFDRVVYIKIGNKLTELTIGNTAIMANGIRSVMDVAPFIKNNRTYVPLRVIAEALGCKVGWVESERKVIILER